MSDMVRGCVWGEGEMFCDRVTIMHDILLEIFLV